MAKQDRATHFTLRWRCCLAGRFRAPDSVTASSGLARIKWRIHPSVWWRCRMVISRFRLMTAVSVTLQLDCLRLLGERDYNTVEDPSLHAALCMVEVPLGQPVIPPDSVTALKIVVTTPTPLFHLPC